jgi:hypothetical protein
MWPRLSAGERFVCLESAAHARSSGLLMLTSFCTDVTSPDDSLGYGSSAIEDSDLKLLAPAKLSRSRCGEMIAHAQAQKSTWSF